MKISDFAKILDFRENLGFWRKFRIFEKIWIFAKILDFREHLGFSRKSRKFRAYPNSSLPSRDADFLAAAKRPQKMHETKTGAWRTREAFDHPAGVSIVPLAFDRPAGVRSSRRRLVSFRFVSFSTSFRFVHV